MTVPSSLFRQKGIEATGIAEIMSAAGLTHGGFYRHFTSKDELVCAAIERAFETILNWLQGEIEQQGAKAALNHYVEQYLSQGHVERPGKGCPIAALGTEAARGPQNCKELFDKGSERLVDLLAQAYDGEPETARQKATSLLVILVGTLIMARAAGSKELMQKRLRHGLQSCNLPTDQ